MPRPPHSGRLPLTLLLAAGVLVLDAVGCSAPEAEPEVQARPHWADNDAVRQTLDQQLLLNLVRLRYDEMPLVLLPRELANDYALAPRGAKAGAGLPPIDDLVRTGDPELTWSLLDERALQERLQTPLGARQLLAFAQAGWGEERVLRVAVKRLNRLRNREVQVGKGISEPPSLPLFEEAVRLLGELRRAELLELASRPAGKFPEGARPLALRLTRLGQGDPRAARLRELLGLRKDGTWFPIVDADDALAEQDLTELALGGRSALEVLHIAASCVEVPPEHVARSYVDDVSLNQSDWLRVRSSPERPEQAWLEVEHRSTWFFIAQDDVPSRETFTLLQALFGAAIGEGTEER